MMRRHQDWRILECVCAEEIVRGRLEDESLSGTHPARNRTYDLYQEVRSRFESITLPKTVINTSEALRAMPPESVGCARLIRSHFACNQKACQGYFR